MSHLQMVFGSPLGYQYRTSSAAIYLKYLYSVKPVRMHFPAKQLNANVTEGGAALVTCCCDVLRGNFECFSVR
jgi:hypothetical protein